MNYMLHTTSMAEQKLWDLLFPLMKVCCSHLDSDVQSLSYMSKTDPQGLSRCHEWDRLHRGND